MGYDISLKVWDMRNPNRWEKQFTAHTGPAFSIDWHPEEKHWIATGGRDKMIKVSDGICKCKLVSADVLSCVYIGCALTKRCITRSPKMGHFLPLVYHGNSFFNNIVADKPFQS